MPMKPKFFLRKILQLLLRLEESSNVEKIWVASKRKNFLWNRKISYRKASSNLLKLCLLFEGMFESSIADKMGKQQKEEVLK